MTTATSPFRPLGLGIIVLTLTTAAIHLYLGSLGLPMFVLNGLGYLALLTALYAPIPGLAPYKNLVRWALIGYTALTIVLWLFITGGASTTLGYADKVVELVLITLLLLDHHGQRA